MRKTCLARLQSFDPSRTNNPRIARILVMGPWIHGGWSRGDGRSLGDISFQAKTAEFYRHNIELPFLKSHLKGEENNESAQGVRLRDRHQSMAAV